MLFSMDLHSQQMTHVYQSVSYEYHHIYSNIHSETHIFYQFKPEQANDMECVTLTSYDGLTVKHWQV